MQIRVVCFNWNDSVADLACHYNSLVLFETSQVRWELLGLPFVDLLSFYILLFEKEGLQPGLIFQEADHILQWKNFGPKAK